MNPATIVINKKTFILDFGMGVFRALGEKFNEPTLLGVQKRILSVLGEIEEDISFDQLDMLNALIMASVVPVNEGDALTTKELDKLAYDFIISKDATPSFLNYNGFPGTICTSINDYIDEVNDGYE